MKSYPGYDFSREIVPIQFGYDFSWVRFLLTPDKRGMADFDLFTVMDLKFWVNISRYTRSFKERAAGTDRGMYMQAMFVFVCVSFGKQRKASRNSRPGTVQIRARFSQSRLSFYLLSLPEYQLIIINKWLIKMVINISLIQMPVGVWGPGVKVHLIWEWFILIENFKSRFMPYTEPCQ